MKREKLVLLLCSGGFAMGLIFCFGAGLYWLDIADKFLTDYGLTLVAFVQAVLVGWVIGGKKLKALQDDVNERSELKAGFFWKWSLKLVTPAVLLVILVLAFLKLVDKGYEGYDTMALVYAGVVPALLVLVFAFFLQSMKGAGDED
jgi:SNF family Na+-dependent transporter